jgi:uncharacterized protein CbrC (UPF0167 family)
MSATLPHFTYHPDPVSTGAVVPTEEECECCGRAQSWKTAKSIYSADEVECICPWCVADGTAAVKFEGDFNDAHPLNSARLAPEIVEEVSKRTPSYQSWQQETWLICCNDACEFHGDASRESLLALDLKGLEQLSKETRFSLQQLAEILKLYQPKGSPSFYRFVCRHCSKVHHHADFD